MRSAWSLLCPHLTSYTCLGLGCWFRFDCVRFDLLPLLSPIPASVKSQNIHEHSQEHVDDVVDRLHRSNRADSGLPGTHLAGYFFETKLLALENHQRFDFGILQRKTATEYLESLSVDTNESRCRVMN